MSKKVFKVGDRVREIKNVAFASTQDVLGTVRVIDESSIIYYGVEFDKNIGGHNMLKDSKPEYKKGHCYYVSGEDLVKAENPSIHITADGNKTIAVMKQGKQEVGRGVATCNPSDEFDFKTGAKLAMDRLLGEEIKGNYVTGVREVSRKAKVGEYIKIVKKGCHGSVLVVGDIHKVTNVTERYIDTDKMNVFRNNETHEYVVLENYNPEKTESVVPTQTQDDYLSFKKVKRRAEVGEYVLVVDANMSDDCYKNGEIYRAERILNSCIAITTEKTHAALNCRNHESPLWQEEYVVLEGYQPPKTFENHADNTFTKEQVLKAVEKALEK